MNRPIPPPASGLLLLAFATSCAARTMDDIECWTVSEIHVNNTVISMPAITEDGGCTVTHSISLCMDSLDSGVLEYRYAYDCESPTWSGEYALPISIHLHPNDTGFGVVGTGVDWHCREDAMTCERADGALLVLEPL